MQALETATVDDWPDPVELLNADSPSELVLICEHASNHIPAEYGGLGVSPSELQRHIAWDVGAAAVTRGLAEALGCAAFLGTYSRLLVDLNRPYGSDTSRPIISEYTEIPGNRNLAPQELAHRRARIFDPFHNAVAAFLDRRAMAGTSVRIAAIHSFTPVYRGVARPWHVGILYERPGGYPQRVMAALAQDPTLVVGENEPYTIDRESDYAIPVHGTDRGHPALLLEIRNDLIADAAGARDWTTRLAAIL